MNRTLGLLSALISLLFFVPPSLPAEGKSRILVAYFTWAENTVVIDRAKAIRDANVHVFGMENSSSPDGVTTASVIPPGNVAKIASWIGEATGGDLYSIRVRDKYSCYWDEILDRASREKARRERPGLVGPLPDMGDYDVIFLGFPTWWYTIPMAVATFVESGDLSGKRIIPFVTHGTSGVARSTRDLGNLLPPAAVLEREIGVYRSEVDRSRPEVLRWLSDSGFGERED